MGEQCRINEPLFSLFAEVELDGGRVHGWSPPWETSLRPACRIDVRSVRNPQARRRVQCDTFSNVLASPLLTIESIPARSGRPRNRILSSRGWMCPGQTMTVSHRQPRPTSKPAKTANGFTSISSRPGAGPRRVVRSGPALTRTRGRRHATVAGIRRRRSRPERCRLHAAGRSAACRSGARRRSRPVSTPRDCHTD